MTAEKQVIVMTAKFASKCLACFVAIRKGEKIQYTPGVGATHAACWTPERATKENTPIAAAETAPRPQAARSAAVTSERVSVAEMAEYFRHNPGRSSRDNNDADRLQRRYGNRIDDDD